MRPYHSLEKKQAISQFIFLFLKDFKQDQIFSKFNDYYMQSLSLNHIFEQSDKAGEISCKNCSLELKNFRKKIEFYLIAYPSFENSYIRTNNLFKTYFSIAESFSIKSDLLMSFDNLFHYEINFLNNNIETDENVVLLSL